MQRRDGQVDAGRAGGNGKGAGEGLIIGAGGRRAAKRVVHRECGGGAAGAGKVELTGGGGAFGERGDAVAGGTVGIDEDGGLLVVVEPERGAARGLPGLIGRARREGDDDGLKVFGERVVHGGDRDVDGISPAAVGKGD